MKVALLCKSDTTGGAAVVTFRLMNALRKAGVDARMVVAEKLSDSPFVSVASTPAKRRRAFLLERLGIFIRNGFNRETLFRIDTGAEGAGVCSDPIVKEADIICLNWVNQGFVSLADIRKLGKMGKKIVWTMHDMWNMTGICHHAGSCMRYRLPDGDCSLCPLLGLSRGRKLSLDTWRRKKRLYADTPIHFVAVSRWLAALARESTLMQDADIRVIPNAFPICGDFKPHRGEPFRIVFGAARIDDPVKGHETLVEATRLLARRWPEEAARMELVTFGNMKNPEALAGIGIKHRHLGVIPPLRSPPFTAGPMPLFPPPNGRLCRARSSRDRPGAACRLPSTMAARATSSTTGRPAGLFPGATTAKKCPRHSRRHRMGIAQSRGYS